MNVLVFNVGSTTLKFACIDTKTSRRLCSGAYDRIGQDGGDAVDHITAARAAMETVGKTNIDAIAHRIVQGGAIFRKPTLVSGDVLEQLKTLDALAPLHNPHARRVVESLTALGIEQTLVFDTAYFSTLSPAAYRYAVPQAIYEKYGVRRYGFHGTSHQFVVAKAIDFLGNPPDAKIISLHLGGGASATASIGGVAVDTSMGMTPLEGLVMASRCGDVDLAVAFHLIENAKMSPAEVDNMLNKQSGLMGLCGESDMRRVLQRRDQGDAAATLAIDIYVRKIIKTIGGYIAILGGLDALVFTAGIGENCAAIRQLVCEPLGHFGIEIEAGTNRDCPHAATDLSSPKSTVKTIVVPTDEELAIALQIR